MLVGSFAWMSEPLFYIVFIKDQCHAIKNTVVKFLTILCAFQYSMRRELVEWHHAEWVMWPDGTGVDRGRERSVLAEGIGALGGEVTGPDLHELPSVVVWGNDSTWWAEPVTAVWSRVTRGASLFWLCSNDEKKVRIVLRRGTLDGFIIHNFSMESTYNKDMIPSQRDRFLVSQAQVHEWLALLS